MTLLCAVLFAVHMVLVSKLSRFYDVLALTAVQFVAEGCMGLLSGAAFETFPGFAVFTPDIIGQLLFLAIFASIVRSASRTWRWRIFLPRKHRCS